MDNPLAYFFTWPTYGTWLPGDQRGWVLFKRGWQLPDSSRYLESQARKKHAACTLGPAARQIVELQVNETCRHRDWTLHAVNCRSNHMHVVVGSANTDPKKIRKDLKAWCTRRLKQSIDPTRDAWWRSEAAFDGSSTTKIFKRWCNMSPKHKIEKQGTFRDPKRLF